MKLHTLLAMTALTAFLGAGVAAAEDSFPGVPADVINAAQAQTQSAQTSAASPEAGATNSTNNTSNVGAPTSSAYPGVPESVLQQAASSGAAQNTGALPATAAALPALPGSATISLPSGETIPVPSGIAAASAPLSVNATVMPVLPQDGQNAIVAVLSLDAKNAQGPLTLGAVPFTMAQNGVAADFSALSSCSLNNTTNGTQISGFVQKTGTGEGNFVLNSPLSLQAGQASTVVMRCSFSSAMHVGSSFTFGFPARAFAATTESGAAVAAAQGTTIAGTPGTNAGTAVVYPSTPAPSSPSSTPVAAPYYAPPAPGVPNTGAGGGAVTTYALLVASSILALIASVYALMQLRAMRKGE